MAAVDYLDIGILYLGLGGTSNYQGIKEPLTKDMRP